MQGKGRRILPLFSAALIPRRSSSATGSLQPRITYCQGCFKMGVASANDCHEDTQIFSHVFPSSRLLEQCFIMMLTCITATQQYLLPEGNQWNIWPGSTRLDKTDGLMDWEHLGTNSGGGTKICEKVRKPQEKVRICQPRKTYSNGRI